MHGVDRSHAGLKPLGDVFLRHRLDLLDVELAVEQILIDPLAALSEKPVILFGGIGIPNRARHFLAGAQGAEVPDSAKRVGADELYVVSVVLDPLHDPVPVGIPAARNPSELESAFRVRPESAKPLRVAG